eukprot:9337-Heterococcus_DN1.PRE.6
MHSAVVYTALQQEIDGLIRAVQRSTACQDRTCHSSTVHSAAGAIKVYNRCCDCARTKRRSCKHAQQLYQAESGLTATLIADMDAHCKLARNTSHFRWLHRNAITHRHAALQSNGCTALHYSVSVKCTTSAPQFVPSCTLTYG